MWILYRVAISVLATVFQSSKFEPVSDAPSGYVVLNNADGTALVVPQTNLLSGFLNTNSAHDFHSNYTQDFGNICATSPQTFIQQPQPTSILPLIPTLSDVACIAAETPVSRIQATMNLENNSHIVRSEKRSTKLATTSNNCVSPKNSGNMSSPNSIQGSPIYNIKNCNLEDFSMVTNEYSNDLNVQVTYKEADICKIQGKSVEAKNIHSKHKIHIKPKVASKYIKRLRTPKNAKLVIRNNLPKELKLNHSKESISNNLISKITGETDTHHKISNEDNVEYLPLLNTNYNKVNNDPQACSERNCNGFEVRIETPENGLELKDLTQNIVPRLKNRSVSQFYVINTTKLPPTTSSFGSSSSNVPTNIVAPILQIHQNSNTPSRPTNRVLPMQSIHKPADKSKLKSITLKRSSFKDNVNKLLDTTFSDVAIKNRALPIAQDVGEKNNEILKFDSELTNMNALLKSKNEESEAKSNISCFSNRLNIEKLLISDDTLDLKKVDSNIPLNHSGNPDENKLKVISSEDFSIKSLLSEKKNDVGERKSITESTEAFTDTQLQKSYDQTCEQNECLNFVVSTDLSKLNFKSKSPKQTVTDQYSLSNQTISCFPSKKRFENEDLKKSTEPHLIYEIQSEDGFTYKSNSIADVWEKVFEAVQSARRAHGLISLPIGPFAEMCGVQIIGLKTNALKYLIEQLPGTERCTKYTPKYHKNPSTNAGSDYVYQDQEEWLENIYGAIRCEPFSKRSDYDLFSWLASRHRKQPKQIFVQPSDTELIARRCTGNLPMAMKYRTLKETCKHNVGVFRSLIHGRGLFCTKDIEAGEMVIEYAGELIRSTLTDKRERFYDSRGIGCYMFKIDDNFVVDATMRGNAARFINHSCEPNCYSKVVDILGHKHIIIFSLRRIVQGEELTYDYKFPFEDVKIPCSCGSKKCRKYLN